MQQIWVVRRIVLLIGVTALLIMILRIIGRISETPHSLLSQSTSAASSISTPLRAQPSDGEFREVMPIAVDDLTVVETPADAWANALLDQIVTARNQLATNVPSPNHGAFVGLLSMESDALAIGEHVFAVNTLNEISITVVPVSTPEQLLPIGEITTDQNVLVLTSSALSQGLREWRLSNATPALALYALLTQAQLHNLRLEASFQSGLAGEAQIDIYTASSANIPLKLTSAEATTQPAVESSPTPTRAPDIVMSQLIAAQIDPAIEDLRKLPPAITADHLDRFARSGILSVTETGIQVASRSITIDKALNLTIYGIDSTSGDGSTVRLLTAYYSDEGTTHFPEEQVYFQGHRMQEILYWMVNRAVEQGGQLIVGYDEVGGNQAITLIGFKEFTEP